MDRTGTCAAPSAQSSRKTYWKWLLLVVGAFALAITLVYFNRLNDPLFEGKPLSEHLGVLRENGLHHGGVPGVPGGAGPLSFDPPRLKLHPADPSVFRAVRAVGTNALPLLVCMLRSKDTRYQREIRDFVERHPALTRFYSPPPPAAWSHQIQALGALGELGPLAAPAVPGIIRLLDHPDTAPVAITALLSIRPEREDHILSLTNVLGIATPSVSGSPPEYVHAMAMLALSTFGTQATRARPDLLAFLDSTNSPARSSGAAAIALAKSGAPAAEIVPRILTHLPATNPAPPSVLLRTGEPAIANMAADVDRDRTILMYLSPSPITGRKPVPPSLSSPTYPLIPMACSAFVNRSRKP